MQLATQSLEQLAEQARISREIAATINDAGFDPTLGDDLTRAAVARLNEMVRNYNAECARVVMAWDARIAALEARP